VETLNPAQ